MSRRRVSSSSRRFNIQPTPYSAAGRPLTGSTNASSSQLRGLKDDTLRAERHRQSNLTARDRHNEDRRNDLHTLDDDDIGDSDMFSSVLDGSALADISHAGEDLRSREDLDDEELLQDLVKSHDRLYSKRREYRTRRNRTKLIFDAFKPQLEALADAYIIWDERSAKEGLGTLLGPPPEAMIKKTMPIFVVDLFTAQLSNVPMLAEDAFVASGLVHLGYFPCASKEPTVALTTRVLEVYRVAHLRCPRLAIQPFVKSLCDIHGVPFRPYLSTQFSIAFDLYLATLAIVNKRVLALLRRDAPNWRLANACAPCMYKLEDELPMRFPILTTHDGNNSLSRFWRQERTDDGAPGASKERVDDREVPGDYYLSREKVDVWGKAELDELMKGFTADPSEESEDDGCSDRWQNMKEEITSKAWGMYDETGVFLSLCRHGFVLIVADMVRSGELSKYGYAVVHHLIHVLGEIAAGLCNLATYVTGMGLEDLEECETFFSKSNALASGTRYATRFHRQQAIATYLQHVDAFETYQSLSLVLSNKYRRALEVKSTAPALAAAMQELGVLSKDTFVDWLAREKECLQSLRREPLEETLQMEYYQKLVNLQEQTKRMDAVLAVTIAPPAGSLEGSYESDARATRRLEAQRRHAMELHNKCLLAVHDLEWRMGIERWEPNSPEWQQTAVMVHRRRYQRALDQLQALIIARMFELTKMNMSGTGYKLRKHIAKALQARSRAVKTALSNYNAAASTLDPPRDSLTWEQVVEYAFLSDFDLLRDGREDIREELWAKPAGRIAMDMHFKIERADEEIIRLNIEIRRLMTYMRDEEAFLGREERRIREEHGGAIAYQVRRYRFRQGRFNETHRLRLWKLSKIPGFTGRLDPGTAINKDRLEGASMTPPVSPPPLAPVDNPEESGSDSEGEAELLLEQFTLMRVTEDSEGPVEGRADV